MGRRVTARSRKSVTLRIEMLEVRDVPASFHGLGFLPGATDSIANDISGDGTVIVGYSGNHAFRWTESGGMVGLESLPVLNSSEARGVSDDGSTVVGTFGAPLQAFRWTQSGGMVGLGTLPGNQYSRANAVSADGSVVVGYSYGTTGAAFRWTQAGGMVNLGFLPGATYTYASDVSADGTIVVGASGGQIFRWTQASGMTSIGVPSYDTYMRVSGDGSTIYYDSNSQATLWTAANGGVGIGFLPGAVVSSVSHVSASASVAVGDSDGRAYYWTQATGMRSLAQILTYNFGLGGQLANWNLYGATGFSANGLAFAGTGGHSGLSEAWIATIESPPPPPPPSSGPTVTSWSINDGAVQRSIVTSLTVSFSEGVTFPNGIGAAFRLDRDYGGTVNLVPIQNGATVRMTFAPGGSVGLDPGGSLPWGKYRLTVIGANTVGAGGILYGGTDFVTPGGIQNYGRIFRLFGDFNGDGTLSAFDFIQFRLAFGGTSSIFDYDNDGAVAAWDFIQFRLGFGSSI